PLVDLDFLVYFSASEIDVQSNLPPAAFGAAWDVLIDTAGGALDAAPMTAGASFVLRSRSVVVLRAHTDPAPPPDHSVAASLALLARGRSATAAPPSAAAAASAAAP
ncbi:MAG TPA: glycogen debranching enzyme, partial [Amnibacterium sp.]